MYLSKVDVVTIYGRPGDGLMEKAAAKCEAELPPKAVVISHFFDVPGLLCYVLLLCLLLVVVCHCRWICIVNLIYYATLYHNCYTILILY